MAIIERGSTLSSLSELYALPGRVCLSCLTPESDKDLLNLAYSCRDLEFFKTSLLVVRAYFP